MGDNVKRKDFLNQLKNLKLSAELTQKLKIYRQELIKCNQQFSLIASSSLDSLMLDSLMAGQLLLKSAGPQPIADIGSGAGFPGIVLSLLDPEREFYLYEIKQKKAQFLAHIIYQLDLKNVQVKNMPIQKEKIGHLSQAVSKAFFSLSKRLALTAPIFKEGASYYHLQSISYEKEWLTGSSHLKKAWALHSVQEYSHPFFSKRVLLKFVRQ